MKITVKVIDKKCPVPVIETRKAVMRAKSGDTIEVVGFDPPSKKEVQMVAEAAKLNIVSVSEDKEGIWTVVIQKE